MILKERFTKKEKKIIEVVNKCLQVCIKGVNYRLEATYHAGLVHIEAYFEDGESRTPFVLQFEVRDKEDVFEDGCNFIHTPSIYIPPRYQNQRIGTILLISLAKAAYEMNLAFFVTHIINEQFFAHLIRIGGVADEVDDIELFYPDVKERIQELVLLGELT